MKSILVSVVLMFLIFTSTTTVYSQFAITDEDVLDNISEFQLVVQNLGKSSQGNLVPNGVIRGAGDVYFVTFEYEIIVRQGLNLYVETKDLLFSNIQVSDETLQSTFDFHITQTPTGTIDYHEHMLGEEILAYTVTVHLTVSMNEPPTYELYRQLAGGSLTFEVYFFAV